MLRKFACICTPCLCFYVASSGMGKNYYFSKRCFPWICCMLQVGLISFITCFCALCLSLAVSNSLANKIRWRLSARKKPVVKISYLQEIKSSRDILTTSIVPNYTETGLSPTSVVFIHANFGCASLRWNWSLANLCCALNLEKIGQLLQLWSCIPTLGLVCHQLWLCLFTRNLELHKLRLRLLDLKKIVETSDAHVLA